MSASHTPQMPTTAKADVHREKWLSIRASNSEAGTTGLRSFVPDTYAWLRRNDFEWLKANTPQPRPRLPSLRVNWKERDQQLAEAARIASFRQRNMPGPPVQITVARVGRNLGKLALIQKHLNKLPMTAEVLAMVVDTRESFAVRRITYCTHLYELEGIIPKRWQLIRRAGLRPQVANASVVDEALKAAMHYVSTSSFSQPEPRIKVA